MTDHTTEYARKVASGEITASESVIAECRRHLADLADPRFRFDVGIAERVAAWVEQAAEYMDGDFVMFDWMRFFVGRLYGMLWADGQPKAGLRRFTRAFLITGRGSGKSVLVGILCLWHLFEDGVREPLVLIAARDRNQADSSFKDAVGALEGSPIFKGRGKRLGGNFAFRIVSNEHSNGEIQKISGDAKSAIGRRQTMVVLDEYAQHRDNSMVESILTGFKGVKQPLTIFTTNAGELLDTPAGQYYLTAKRTAKGETESDILFPFVAECDEYTDDPMEDESCWVKANPSLPQLPGIEEVREDIKAAKANPNYRDSMLRLRFGFWRPSSDVWVKMAFWEKAMVGSDEWDETEEERRKLPCYIGLDLSEKNDLTGGALVWCRPDGTYLAEVVAWTPDETLPERGIADGIPYQSWHRMGQLRTCPGRTMRYDFIAQWLGEQGEKWDVRGAAYDKWRMKYVIEQMDNLAIPWTKKPGGKGIWLVEHGATFYAKDKMTKADRKAGRYQLWMPGSLDATESILLEERITIKDSRPLIMAAHGMRLLKDGVNNRRPTKKDSLTKTDVLIALIQAIGLATFDESNRNTGPAEAEFDALEAFLLGAPA